MARTKRTARMSTGGPSKRGYNHFALAPVRRAEPTARNTKRAATEAAREPIQTRSMSAKGLAPSAVVTTRVTKSDEKEGETEEEEEKEEEDQEEVEEKEDEDRREE
ncbi:hypothetical protein MPSEU_000312600 [Mayamaea pseudoterrestris]|nr:hypothetical protein MPSEU_000312600 [Mayamaea pseudoterrestris]